MMKGHDFRAGEESHRERVVGSDDTRVALVPQVLEQGGGAEQERAGQRDQVRELGLRSDEGGHEAGELVRLRRLRHIHQSRSASFQITLYFFFVLYSI